MKKLNFSLCLALAIVIGISSCAEQEDPSPPQFDPEKDAVGAWQTVISNSFSDYSSLEADWEYLYPWGSDHNGTARMYASSSDHNHVYLSGNVLNIKASHITWDEGNSSADPYLPIEYHSGAINSKHHVLINDQYPNYEIKGEFQAPSGTGTWPAFWITGANSWPPESDIMEFKGSSTVWQNTYDGSWETETNYVSSPGSWHEYRIWMTKANSTDVTIHYYIDGNWQGQHTGSNFVGEPMDIIINLQMEGSSGTPGPTSDTYMRARNVYVGRSKAY